MIQKDIPKTPRKEQPEQIDEDTTKKQQTPYKPNLPSRSAEAKTSPSLKLNESKGNDTVKSVNIENNNNNNKPGLPSRPGEPKTSPSMKLNESKVHNNTVKSSTDPAKVNIESNSNKSRKSGFDKSRHIKQKSEDRTSTLKQSETLTKEDEFRRLEEEWESLKQEKQNFQLEQVNFHLQLVNLQKDQKQYEIQMRQLENERKKLEEEKKKFEELKEKFFSEKKGELEKDKIAKPKFPEIPKMKKLVRMKKNAELESKRLEKKRFKENRKLDREFDKEQKIASEKEKKIKKAFQKQAHTSIPPTQTAVLGVTREKTKRVPSHIRPRENIESDKLNKVIKDSAKDNVIKIRKNKPPDFSLSDGNISGEPNPEDRNPMPLTESDTIVQLSVRKDMNSVSKPLDNFRSKRANTLSSLPSADSTLVTDPLPDTSFVTPQTKPNKMVDSKKTKRSNTIGGFGSPNDVDVVMRLPPPPPLPVRDRTSANLREVPLELLDFPNIITTLRLQKNRLQTLPPEIADCVNLTTLNLSYNLFETTPEVLSNCTTLTELDIAGNYDLVFPEPISRNFQNLRRLVMNSINLTLFPVHLCRLPYLEILDLSNNQIRDISPEIRLMTSLTGLKFSNNKLGRIVPEIGNCTNLVQLSFNDNKLKQLPEQMANLSKLEELNLVRNRITEFPISFTLEKLPALAKIDVHRNFIDKFPMYFFNGAAQSNLEEIYVGHNNISSLPPDFWLCNFVLIDFKNNNLAEISSEIGNLQNLKILDLGYNRLHSIPPTIGSCTTLETLNLFGNFLEDIPTEVQFLTNLKRLYLGYNQIKEIPFLETARFEQLMELFLSGNPIKRFKISDNFPNVTSLFLNGMELEVLPPEIGNFKYLEQLDVSHNQIREIPSELRGATSLESLDISHNKICDPVDKTCWDWIFSFPCLAILDLSYNNLSQEPVYIYRLLDQGVDLMVDHNPWTTNDPSSSAPVSARQTLTSPRARNLQEIATDFRTCGPRYEVGWSEFIGRRPTQEDAICISGPIGPPSEDIALFGLFDGHAGRYAASYCALNFPSTFAYFLDEQRPFKDKDAPLTALKETFYSVNNALKDEIKFIDDSSLKHCGSTGVVVVIINNTIYVANVGDSRAVLYRGRNTARCGDNRIFGSSSLSTVVRLSEDHKPDLEVERIRSAGGFVVDHRLDGVLAVSRSIGDFFMAPKVTCEPSVFKYPLFGNEDEAEEMFILLCCDGVWDEISDEQACGFIKEAKRQGLGLHKSCAMLRDYAFFFGSDDNITVMVVQVKPFGNFTNNN